MIKLIVNGEEREIEREMSIEEFLKERGLDPRTLVVEHNREILPRDGYAEARLKEGDEVEIVGMMAGG